MTVGKWIKENILILEDSGVETARLDSLVLLSDEIGRDKAWVLAHPEQELTIEQIESLNVKIAQRAKHTPLAYIRGKAEFYDREFIVDEHVLVPRPESESMIELLKKVTIHRQHLNLIDVGTGSGCLAVTAKIERPNSQVIAVDIDESCLAIAKKNAEKFGAKIQFLQGDLLHPVRGSRFKAQDLIILANLPYVPEGYLINEAAKHEPGLALFSGKDGLDHYRALFAQAVSLKQPPELIITESLPSQHDSLAEIAAVNSYRLSCTDGLAQLYKI